jgi:PAS domain-containing protein
VHFFVGQNRMSAGPVVVLQVVELSRIERRLLSPFGTGLFAVCSVLSLLIWSLNRTRLDLADHRMQLLREQAHRALVLDQMHSIVIVLDSDGAVVEWNHSAAQTLGVPREQTLGRPLLDLDIA